MPTSSERELLMIPGPIEFDPAVLRAMAKPTLSHVSPEFVEIFGAALAETRKVFLSTDGQPFVIAGSGTFALELGIANLIEPGDRALVVNSGVFSDRFGVCIERHGGEPTNVKAEIGSSPSLEQIESALKQGKYKLVTVTQVDTSTGVLSDVKGIARLARQYGALSLVDGVCATGAEEFRQSDWGVDACVTASQKAFGVPPGLAIAVFGPDAIASFERRKSPVRSYYADFGEWLPIMRAYEARKAAYYGTPPVNLIYALAESLRQIHAEGMEARFARHRRLSAAFQAGVRALGLSMIPKREEWLAHTLSAICFPMGVDASLVGRIKAEGVVVAGGLHPANRATYFRVGHMGAVNPGDLLTTLGAIERALRASGYRFAPGAGVAAFERTLAAD
jgi:alanine-glyoxylate transaminase / serine-glyoxylate transaminase / serine-pyruvate transaminase